MSKPRLERNPKRCQTPGAIFRTQIHTRTEVSVSVELPFPLDLNGEEAQALETNMHDAIERVLARYFVHPPKGATDD